VISTSNRSSFVPSKTVSPYPACPADLREGMVLVVARTRRGDNGGEGDGDGKECSRHARSNSTFEHAIRGRSRAFAAGALASRRLARLRPRCEWEACAGLGYKRM